MEQNDNFQPKSYRRHLNPEPRFLKTRNILNIIFMLGAIAGIIVYFSVGETAGIIVVLVAMTFKIIECVLRFLH